MQFENENDVGSPKVTQFSGCAPTQVSYLNQALKYLSRPERIHTYRSVDNYAKDDGPGVV